MNQKINHITELGKRSNSEPGLHIKNSSPSWKIHKSPDLNSDLNSEFEAMNKLNKSAKNQQIYSR